MKKLLSLTLAALLCLTCLCFPTQAETTENTQIIQLEDGGYLEITLSSVRSRGYQTTDAYKYARRYDGDNNLEWVFTLHAVFSYLPGTEASCLSADSSYQIIDSAWRCTSHSATPGFASATGNATFIRKVLLVTVNTVPISISINCDTYGNLT